MPGRSLNDDERALQREWNDPGRWNEKPQLLTIEVKGGTGLRGIDGLIVPFRYPVCAICGNNGVGKSTILALASLAHHSPEGWFVHRANTKPQTVSGDRSYYIFQDFFLGSPDEAPPNEVEVTWRYSGNDSDLTFKKTRTWGVYSKRPEREADFLPLSRILPAYEMRGVSRTFSRARTDVHTAQLNKVFLGYLEHVVGHPYDEATVSSSTQYFFQACNDGNAEYSAYNMGGGESCLINLLYLLQRMPRGGLLVVEEIEAGLPPHAQRRLASVLMKVCLQKRIQVICSTHSDIFLDSLPRQARLLLIKKNNEHCVVEAPSTRLAMHAMAGVSYPELLLYCEDNAARILIEEALPTKIRHRVQIKKIGSDVVVIRQGISHLRSGYPMRSLCVLDGDATEGQVQRWCRAESGGENVGLNYLILPGEGLAPEKWILEQLNLEDYQREFADRFDCSIGDARQHIAALQVVMDHHNIAFELSQRTGLGESDCRRRLMSTVVRHPQLDALRERVAELIG